LLRFVDQIVGSTLRSPNCSSTTFATSVKSSVARYTIAFASVASRVVGLFGSAVAIAFVASVAFVAFALGCRSSFNYTSHLRHHSVFNVSNYLSYYYY
jgi:hypothetical protein